MAWLDAGEIPTADDAVATLRVLDAIRCSAADGGRATAVAQPASATQGMA
jgi:hypothetical protein